MSARNSDQAKAERMTKVVEAVYNLEASPLYDYRKKKGYHPVIGEGNLDADVMFIGEAPGAQEARTGRPFVGNAGQILNELLASIGLKRADIYITNIVKDRPPENRDPSPEELALYAPFLRQQIAIINPRAIVTLGRFAMDFVLDEFHVPEAGGRISDLHGRVLKTDEGKLTIIPLYHPAAAFYNTDLKSTLKEDFRMLKPFVEH